MSRLVALAGRAQAALDRREDFAGLGGPRPPARTPPPAELERLNAELRGLFGEEEFRDGANLATGAAFREAARRAGLGEPPELRGKAPEGREPF